VTTGRPRLSPFAVTLGLTLHASAAHSGALEALAREAAQLGPIVGPALVVAAPLVSDRSARAEDLPLRLGALVAAQLGAEAKAYPQSGPLPLARAAAGRQALVFVRVAIALGEVRMTAELYPPLANSWDRIASPPARPTRQAVATAKVDAQVRALLPALTLDRASVKRFRHDEEDVLALACGDVDGDGSDDLLVLSRRRIALGRLQGSAFTVERTATWSGLAPRVAVPARQPLAGAVADRAAIDVGSTDYGGLELARDLTERSRLSGIPVWGGRGPACLVAQPAAGAFDGAPIDCAPSRDPKPALAVPAPRFDAFAAADVVDAKGAVRSVVAVREPSGGLRLRFGDETDVVDGSFGAQIAVGDLDQDGAPDVVTTSDRGDDAIDVLTVAPGTAPQRRLHLAAPEPVRALAVCPPGELGAPALAAVVGREVWLVRAGEVAAPRGSP
jgi:hypothetical protein